MPSKLLQDACVDCQAVEASLDIRKRRLCPDCFIRYVQSKVLKRMESYRLKNGGKEIRTRLLLPLSGGISSLVLLHILDAQLQKQLTNMNRTAYELHVLMVDSTETPGSPGQSNVNLWYEGIQGKYPSHIFVPLQSLGDVFIYDRDFEKDVQVLGLRRHEGEGNADFASRIVCSSKSASVRSDLQQILLIRLIGAYAKDRQCEGVLWGHSDSRLAAKALAGVANGRGGSLPVDIGDTTLPSGITVKYPMRDLLKPELDLYGTLLVDTLPHVLSRNGSSLDAPLALRNTSIDQLLTTYINSQGEKYPSIMANVVRTVNKLQSPPRSPDVAACLLCTTSPTVERELCYGCRRLSQDVLQYASSVGRPP